MDCQLRELKENHGCNGQITTYIKRPYSSSPMRPHVNIMSSMWAGTAQAQQSQMNAVAFINGFFYAAAIVTNRIRLNGDVP